MAVARADKGKAVKAVLDARRVPFDLFGQGRAAHLRKFVFLYLASWADPDGTDAYPALKTIATDCGLTVRGLSNILDWLAQHGLITVEYKASHVGTNKYAVLLTNEALNSARLKIESDEGQAAIRAKAANARQARSDAAKRVWANRRASADVERSIPGDVERSVLCGPGTDCITPGTDCIRRGTLRSTDRPLGRPSDRERDRAAQTETASLPVDAVETDYNWIAVEIVRSGWPTTPQAEQIARAYLKAGHKKELILKAVEAAMDRKPEAERQPGLYLAQTLKANVDLLIADAKRVAYVRCEHADEDRRPSPPTQESDAERLERIAALESMLKAPTGAAATVAGDSQYREALKETRGVTRLQ